MTDAAKRALIGIANKNYLEMVEKRKKEQQKEREEMERLKKKYQPKNQEDKNGGTNPSDAT